MNLLVVDPISSITMANKFAIIVLATAIKVSVILNYQVIDQLDLQFVFQILLIRPMKEQMFSDFPNQNQNLT